MKELLERYGYTFDGNCHCDGFATEKYKNDYYQIRIRTGKQTFKIRRGGASLTMWIPIEALEHTLKTYHPELIKENEATKVHKMAV